MLHCLIKQTPHFRRSEFLVIILCSLLLLLGFPACAACPAALTSAVLWVKQRFEQVAISQGGFFFASSFFQILSLHMNIKIGSQNITLHSEHECLNAASLWNSQATNYDYLKGDCREVSNIIGGEKKASSCPWRGLDWILEEISGLKGLSNAGIGSLGRQLYPHPWRYLKDEVMWC